MVTVHNYVTLLYKSILRVEVEVSPAQWFGNHVCFTNIQVQARCWRHCCVNSKQTSWNWTAVSRKQKAYSNNEKTNKVTWIQIVRTIYFNRCLVEPTCSQGGLLLKIPNLGGLHPHFAKTPSSSVGKDVLAPWNPNHCSSVGLLSWFYWTNLDSLHSFDA